MKTINQLREAIKNSPARSAWSKGVKLYALELIKELPAIQEFYGSPADQKTLLDGADDWKQFSWYGCSLIYDEDIAERLCNPNAKEKWLDVQARALYQAAALILDLAKD